MKTFVLLVSLLIFGTACKRRAKPAPTSSPEVVAKEAKAAQDTDWVKSLMADVDARPAPESAKASRADWLRAIAVGAYDKVGERNPAWDALARAALSDFAELNTATPKEFDRLSRRVAESARQAVTAGCTDPLIGYLNIRFNAAGSFGTAKERAAKYRQVADRILASSYHPLRKLHICLRAAEAFDATVPKGTAQLPEAGWLRNNAVGALHHALKDRNVPEEEVYTACLEVLQMFKWSRGAFETFFLAQEPVLHRNWPKSHIPHLFMGKFWTTYAWNARGSGYAEKVTNEGWKLFEDRLSKADTELAKAWKINPKDERIALNMISVELGQGKGRARMEEWFQHAMTINPESYSACTAKLHYLEPKWHGSAEAMLAFGRECVASTVWKGTVPLALAEAHWDLASYVKEPDLKKAYWKQPGVWKDIESAYSRFFVLNPEAVSQRHAYAAYAYRCEEWTVLRTQLKLLGEVNHAYFGGKAEFDKMVRLAEANGGQ